MARNLHNHDWISFTLRKPVVVRPPIELPDGETTDMVYAISTIFKCKKCLAEEHFGYHISVEIFPFEFHAMN